MAYTDHTNSKPSAVSLLMRDVYIQDMLPLLLSDGHRIPKGGGKQSVKLYHSLFNGQRYTHFKSGRNKLACYRHDDHRIKVLSGDWAGIRANPDDYEGLATYAIEKGRNAVVIVDSRGDQ